MALATMRLDRHMNDLVMDAEAIRIFLWRQRIGGDQRYDRRIAAGSDAPDVKIGDDRVTILDRPANFRLERRIGGGVDEHSAGIVQHSPRPAPDPDCAYYHHRVVLQRPADIEAGWQRSEREPPAHPVRPPGETRLTQTGKNQVRS